MKMRINANSNIEAVKTKSAEKLFYKYLADKLEGIGIAKIAPFNGQYFDLLYVEGDRAALFKFVDTNEDTFSILSEEIIEVIEEEHIAAKSLLERRLDGKSIPYYFVMPYIELEKEVRAKGIIIDKLRFEELINEELPFEELLSSAVLGRDELLFRLAGEYFIFRPQIDHGEVVIDLGNDKERSQAVLMEPSQMEAVNSLHYGTTFLQGSTGTGKTSVLFAKMIKLARVYAKDKFMYITFSKQLSNEIKELIKRHYPDVENVKVMNFHQFILLLGKKYNLKLNKQSKQNFAKEFQKVFDKVAKIYSGKRFFKGVFVDESENFSADEICFLREISYQRKNILYLSYDEAKRMAPPSDQEDAQSYPCDDRLELVDNYRASRSVARFNLDFQNDINAFSALELERMTNYFRGFSEKKDAQGKAQVIEYESDREMMEKMLHLIRGNIEKGYELSDICVIYPFNERTLGTPIRAKLELKNFLEQQDLKITFAEDESSNFKKPKALMLSNIYNCTNLEFKVVILCYLDMLYGEPQKQRIKDVQKMLNIIYTASGRAKDELYVMIKKDEHRPGVIDLLSQKIF